MKDMKEQLEKMAAEIKPAFHSFQPLDKKLAAERRKVGRPRIRTCSKCGCVEFYDEQTLNKVFQRGLEFFPRVPKCEITPPAPAPDPVEPPAETPAEETK